LKSNFTDLYKETRYQSSFFSDKIRRVQTVRKHKLHLPLMGYSACKHSRRIRDILDMIKVLV